MCLAQAIGVEVKASRWQWSATLQAPAGSEAREPGGVSNTRAGASFYSVKR
jgi:hypothetical protein